MTHISPEIVKNVAALARLSVTPKEIEMYAKDLSVIFSYVDELNEVDTSGVTETIQVTGLADVVRADVPLATSEEIRQKLLAAFPEKEADLLRVKAVFTE